MKHSRKFTFDTPIIATSTHTKHESVVCYARVEGIGYYYDHNHNDERHEDDPESLYDYDIETVRLKDGLIEQDSTIAYKASCKLLDTFADLIHKAANAHMVYLFDDMVSRYWGEQPTTEMHELGEESVDLDRTYQVVAIIGSYDQLKKAS